LDVWCDLCEHNRRCDRIDRSLYISQKRHHKWSRIGSNRCSKVGTYLAKRSGGHIYTRNHKKPCTSGCMVTIYIRAEGYKSKNCYAETVGDWDKDGTTYHRYGCFPACLSFQ
jgi:hypothetical protein